MSTTLVDEVLARLDRHDDDGDKGNGKDSDKGNGKDSGHHDLAELALAALLDELPAYFDGTNPERPTSSQAAAPAPEHAYLSSIEVQGFRGVGPKARLDLSPGPGLTLVIGRNGSGKSSFSEALELLLTGDSQRWAKRSKLWRQGWRNLHHPDQPRVAAELLIDGRPGVTVVERTWGAEGDVADGAAVLVRTGQPTEPATGLGWAAPLVSYRPFLSYNELGSMLDDGPSKLFDALGSILGLEELGDAARRLDDHRKGLEDDLKSAKKQLPALLEQLQAVEDERARRCHAALAGRKWDFEAIDGALGGAEHAQDSDLETLRTLARIPVPDLAAVTVAVANLQQAATAAAAFDGTDAQRSLRIAALLERALELHDQHGERDCPVCRRSAALDAAWRENSIRQIAQLKAEAHAAKTAVDRRATAAAAVRSLVAAPTTGLDGCEAVGIDGAELRQAWDAWNVLRELGWDRLATDAQSSIERIAAAATLIRDQASALKAAREEVWRPMARVLAGWLPGARRGQEQQATVKQLKAAAKRLREIAIDLRNERFAPIADQVKRNWEALRNRSSVDIQEIAFVGASSQRRVDLDVTVDGTQTKAIGVMSQGELHALALCLFLPRATLEASPFRFLLIDDPVQAMDPARVDGLARLLDRVAKERQVVVLTHDDRLPEAVRRQQLPATVLEVRRGDRSEVDVITVRGPVERYVDDARALLLTDRLPPEVQRRVVPGLCRQALEAACVETFRRRRLTRGTPHAEVEGTLNAHLTFMPRLALALFDDPERGDAVSTLNKRVGHWAGDVVKQCTKGAHQGAPFGDPGLFLSRIDDLAKFISRQR